MKNHDHFLSENLTWISFTLDKFTSTLNQNLENSEITTTIHVLAQESSSPKLILLTLIWLQQFLQKTN